MGALGCAVDGQYGGPYGDTFHWIARRKSAGTGEGSSGLKYDLARFEQGEDSWRLVCSHDRSATRFPPPEQSQEQHSHAQP